MKRQDYNKHFAKALGYAMPAFTPPLFNLLISNQFHSTTVEESHITRSDCALRTAGACFFMHIH